MKKLRITAIATCLVTLFAFFTGGVYANTDYAYIDSTTLVIEDGKVVSGDGSLVENGFVVIGDEDVKDHVDVQYGEPVYAPDGKLYPSGKNPVKDNSALMGSGSVDGALPETPNAISPSVPVETEKATVFTSATNPSTISHLRGIGAGNGGKWQPGIYDGFILHDTIEYPTANGQTYGEIDAAVLARGITTTTPSSLDDTNKPYFVMDVKDPIILMKGSNCSLQLKNLLNYNGGRVTLEGYRLKHTNHGENVKSEYNNSSNWSRSDIAPLMVITGGKVEVWETTFQNSLSKTYSYNGAAGNGGAIRVTGGTLSMSSGNQGRTQIIDCESVNGGGLYMSSGTVSLTNTDFSGCKATNGGAIYISGGSLTLNNVTIKGCSATNGGAIYVAGNATLSFTSVKIQGNSATNGGGLYHASGSNSFVVSSETTLMFGGGDHNTTRNTATYGGNIYMANGTLNVSCVVNNGEAPHGGGIYVAGGTLNLNGGRVAYCKGTTGAGIYVYGGDFNMTGGNVYENSASQGGGLAVAEITDGNSAKTAAVHISGGTFYNNHATAGNGGCMWVGHFKSFTISGGSFYNNDTTGYGGGLFFNRHPESAIQINANTSEVKIYGNTADVDGGGIFFGNGDGSITAVVGGGTNNVNIYNNTALRGGGIRLHDGGTGLIDVTLSTKANVYENASTIASSQAYPGGGGVFVGHNCDFKLNGGKIYKNTVNGYGGGIYQAGGTVTISGSSEIYSHTISSYGGGVYMEEGTININGGKIYSNTASQGGGVLSDGPNPMTINVTGGEIYSNTATYGGAFNLDGDSTVNISGGKIYKNTSNTGYGGGFWVGAVTKFEMTGGEIYENKCVQRTADTYGVGGGLFFARNVAEGAVVFSGGKIYKNTADRLGGGIFLGNGTNADQTVSAILGGVSGRTLEIYENKAIRGAGVCVEDGSGTTVTVTMKEGAIIRDNSATHATIAGNGGGVLVETAGLFIMEGGTISGNNSVNGGGVYVDDGVFRMSGGLISENEITPLTTESGCSGAGIFVSAPTTNPNAVIDISGGTVSGNVNNGTVKGGGNGGGIWAGYYKTISIQNCTFTGNNVLNGHGGGMFFNRPTPSDTALTISSVTINANEVAKTGGGIFFGNNQGAIVTSIGGNSNIYGNKAGTNGGGITLAKDGSNTTAVKVTVGDGVHIYGNTAKGGGGGGIYVSEVGVLTINGATVGHTDKTKGNVSNGTTLGGGGICVANGKITANGTSVLNNMSSYFGGGIYLNNAKGVSGNTVSFNNITANGNTCKSEAGGGICINNSTVEITGTSTIDGNTALHGGGICVLDSALTINGATKVTNNVVDGASDDNSAGGGIYASGACSVVINGSETEGETAVSGNTAEFQGGGFYFFGITTAEAVKLNNLTIEGNTARINRGGGIYVNLGTGNAANAVRINGAVFSDNVSEVYDDAVADTDLEGHGGGMYVINCKLYLDNSDFTRNYATVRGGGLYITSNINAIIRNCRFTGNVCNGIETNASSGARSANGRGGALYTYGNSVTNVIDCYFDGNSSVSHAGAIGISGTSSATPELNLVDVTVGQSSPNVAAGNGGGVFAARYAALKIVRGNISNNEAANGGGIYAETTDVSLGISESTSILTVTLDDVAATGEGTVVSGNTATAGNGGGICISSLSNCTISGANIYGNSAPFDTPDESENGSGQDEANAHAMITTGITGNGGGIFVKDTKLTLKNCTIGKETSPNSAAYGGGVAVFKGSALTAQNTSVNNNIAIKSGGGYFILGNGNSEAEKGTSLSVSGGSISGNEAQCTFVNPQAGVIPELGGGAIYARGLSDYNGKGVTCTIDGVSVANNKSLRGGAIFLHEQTDLVIKNCSDISGNEATQLGGVLFMAKGASSADISNCTFTENSAGLRGGALYIQANGCTVDNVQMIRNKANGLSWSAGKGGAIYVTAESAAVTLPLKNVDFTGNESQYGGAICVADGGYGVTVTVDDSDFIGNKASANGGAILVSGASKVLKMTDGVIKNNTAGTEASADSPYQKAYTAVTGVGGGVAVFDSGKFTLTGTGIAIYGNTAESAGDDVFANGKSTSLNIPAPSEMTTDIAEGLWWEDYTNKDSNYANGLNGNPTIVVRYRTTPVSIRAYTDSAEGTSPKGTYVNTSGRYVAIAFGIPLYNVGSVIINAPDVEGDQLFVFELDGVTSWGDAVNLTVSIPAGESVTITNLYTGTYTITQKTNWAWRYKADGVTASGGTVNESTGEVTITVIGTLAVEEYTVSYEGSLEDSKWLNDISPVVPNKAQAPVAVVYGIDLCEFKKPRQL